MAVKTARWPAGRFVAEDGLSFGACRRLTGAVQKTVRYLNLETRVSAGVTGLGDASAPCKAMTVSRRACPERLPGASPEVVWRRLA